MALKIDEKWVRQRVHLKHDNLDDVKSLSLPGSYHEKISHLGTALHSFTRLKHLDLSRNSICNLEGIGHLQMLETLNLYYNNISTLKDLYQLRTLVNLKELDIRLNPVTKNEPDHRLFLVHMLPNLKKLDDRSVRDSERKAALMHFDTDQSTEFTDDRLEDQNHKSSDKLSVPRAELVRNLGPRTVLDNDDILLLDTMAKKDGDLSRPDFITGSSNKFPDVQDYHKQELWDMHAGNEERARTEEPTTASGRYHTGRAANEPPSGSGYLLNNTKPPAPASATSRSKKGAVIDPSYAPYTAQGNFTPTPRPSAFYEAPEHDSDDYGGAVGPNGSIKGREFRESSSSSFGSKDITVDGEQRPAFSLGEERLNRSPDGEDLVKRGHSKLGGKPEIYHTEVANNDSREFRLLHKLVDLVDKYWNGSRSLHNHSKFKELALDLLKSYQPTYEQPEQDKTVKQLRQEMLVKEQELTRLSEQFAQQQEECMAIRSEFEKEKDRQREFEATNEELKTLHARFKKVQEENKTLKTTVESQKSAVNKRQRQSDEAIISHQTVQQENQTLRQQLEQQRANLYQLNELTNMLQESHRSLVATNDHLLLELAEEKDRHQSEVNQLHWSFKQLKKSIDWIPSADKGHHKTHS